MTLALLIHIMTLALLIHAITKTEIIGERSVEIEDVNVEVSQATEHNQWLHNC